MAVNQNVNPRPLTAEEKEKRARGIYDSFATYVVFCGHCRYVRKTNMYIMRAEAFIDELDARGEVCPRCGKRAWTPFTAVWHSLREPQSRISPKSCAPAASC